MTTKTEQPLWVRADVVRVVDRRDTTTVLGTDGVARRFTGDSAELVRNLLDLAVDPAAREVLVRRVAERAGVNVDAHTTRVVEDALEALRDAGVIVAAREPSPVAALGPARARIVLGVAGAIAAIDTPVLVRLLAARRFETEIALTRVARRFVGVAGLESLTHRPVYTRIGQRDDRHPVPHVNLAEWADLVLVCPATATTLARIAGGDCSDLVAAIAVATRAPVVLVPSMNDAMLASAAVQRNLRRLRDDGMHVVASAIGHEVAHAPGARRPMLGPAPPARAVLDVVELVLRTDPRASGRVEIPRSASAWDELYAHVPPERMPWHAAALDPDLRELLEALRPPAHRSLAADPCSSPPGRRFLDLGTGTGTAAIAAADAGFDVTATDVSAVALGISRRRAGSRRVAWMLDDVCDSALSGPFDVVIDRGCFHCLARDA
ncbi:MAG: methyltransferase domain-containing protein, partial [Deltaproteobacteria bacterium]|nr:methyltransferase domain-containing protein [Deltaproteobacteria bacterium]